MDPTKQVACLEYLWRTAAELRDGELLTTNEFEGCLEAVRYLGTALGVERPLMQRITKQPPEGDRFDNHKPREQRA